MTPPPPASFSSKPGEPSLSLYDYWRILRKRQAVVILTFSLVFASTYLFTERQTPVYQSEATLRVEFSPVGAGIGAGMFSENYYGDMMESEVARITSEPVLKLAAANMGSHTEELPGSIRAERTGYTNILRIKATADNPQTAARIADAVSQAYMANRSRDMHHHHTETREYVGQQLDAVKSRLRTTEEALRRFKTEGKSNELLDRYQKRMSELRYQLDNLLKTYTPKHPEVERVKKEITDIKEQLQELPGEELEYNRLSRELKVNEELYILLNRKYKEAELTEADYFDTASVINPPFVPSKPIRPNKPLNLMLGACLGLLLGVIFALVMEHLDTSMYTIDDIERLIERPVLGVIPFFRHETIRSPGQWIISLYKSSLEAMGIHRHRLKSWGRQNHKRPSADGATVILDRKVAEELGEFFHTLAANIRQTSNSGMPQIIVISSATPREGKTFIALNCAIAAVQMGIKVLLVSGDVRRPTLHSILGIEAAPGLMETLTGDCQWTEAIRTSADLLLGAEFEMADLARSPGLEKLHIMPSGATPSNPTEVFGSLLSSRLGDFLNEWTSHYELIIFDSPPILPLADALLIGKHADGVLLVYRTGFATRGALYRVKSQLDNFQLKILGVVLNGLKTSDVEPTYGYYKYKYKYGKTTNR